MADEFKKIISIEIDKSVIANSAKEVGKLSTEIAELKAQQKLVNRSTIEGEQAYQEQASVIKALAKEQRQHNGILTQATTIQRAQTGSIEKARSELSLVSAAWAKLSDDERENTELGKRLTKQKTELTAALKAEEKATGDTRRNVGNYQADVEAALESTSAFGSGLGGMVTGLKAATSASLKFLATPIGAAIGALALAVGAITGLFKLFSESLNRTEEGSAALAKVTQTFSAIMNGVLKVLEPLATTVMQGVADGFDAIGKAGKGASDTLEKGLRFFGLDKQADSVSNFTNAIEESVKGTRELVDAQVELNRINREFQKIQLEYQNRAEKLRQIRDDEALSIDERKKANQELGEVLEEQSQKELQLANRSLEIAKQRARIEGESTENLDAIAEAETKILEIEERITGQRSEQLVNINSLIRDQRAILKEAAIEKGKLSEKAAKEAEKAAKEAEKAAEKAAADLIKGWEDQRKIIDEAAEVDKNNAIATIENAEERAEKIAFIEKEALLKKRANIDEETIAATAGADMIGAADKEKYAKQLAERAKYEAQLATMDRAAKADEFNREIEALGLKEELELQAAELSIDNAEELEAKKQEIALKTAKLRLELLTAFAKEDGIITDKEKKDLQDVQIIINNLLGKFKNPDPDNPTLADMLGLDQEAIDEAITATQTISTALQGVLQLTQQISDSKIDNIDREEQAEISAIQKSTQSEEKKKEKIAAIEKKAAKERYKVELAQFKTAKALQIALAVANTATAVMAQLSNPTPYAGFVLAALAAATGAVQIGIVASQKPPPPPAFAKGGLLRGNTHANGGIPISMKGGGMIEAEDKEIILTKGVYENPKLRNEASRLNVLAGGVPIPNTTFSSGGLVRKFAAGGVAMSSGLIMRENEAQSQLQNTILQTPPVLVLEEFQNVQGRQIRTEQNLQI